MIYTQRDETLIKTLGDYGILSTEQIANMFFKDIALTTVRRRLRLLEKARQLYRVHGLDNGGVAWALTKKAAERVGSKHTFRSFSRNSLPHDVALSEVRNVLERANLCLSWVSEHVLKAQANINRKDSREEPLFVPDAIFSIKQVSETRVIALELELNSKSRKRYENILSRYQRKKTLWAVWYLVPTETMGRNLEKTWKAINYGRRNDLLMWSLLPNFLRDPLNAAIRSEHFSYPLKQLFQPALSTALSESGQKSRPDSNSPTKVF